jgi:hypothetical protein
MAVFILPSRAGRSRWCASHPTGDFTVLPDGRAVWSEHAGGHHRLLLVEAGKDSVVLVNTTEDTAGPVTAAGTGEVAMLIGPQPRRTIAIAILANGRITRRIGFDKGSIAAMAGSPDGKILYCVADGAIWAVPISGDPPRKLGVGNFITMDAASNSLIAEVVEPPNTRLVRLPLDGGPTQEIPPASPFHLGWKIDPGSVRNGRLVAPLGTPYWYWPPGIIDLATGKSARIPLEFKSDFHHMSWTPDGRVMGLALPWHSTIWKFTPEGL